MQVTKNRKEHVIQTNHGASHPKLSDLLLKFGLTCTLLPYVGEWKEWHLVMNLACTQTRKVWKDSLTGYKGLYKSVSWRTHKNEIEEIYKKKFRTSIDIAERTNLFLMASCFSDVSFIIASREMRFPKMNRLELWKTDSLPIYAIKHVSKFLKCCSQGKINELVINSELQMDFSLFNEGLKAVVSNTNRSIKLENLYLNQEIFNSLKGAKELNLINCTVDIQPDFNINVSKEVELEVLNLKRTCKKQSNSYLNSNKLRILIDALSKTPIKQSLKSFQCRESEYSKQEVTQILHEFEFKCVVN